MVDRLNELQDNGDTVELEDGRTLRLSIRPDEDCQISDFDCYGKLEWTRNNDYGPVRPDSFTGRAQILDRDYRGRAEALWWEPCEDMPLESLPSQRQLVKDLMQYGFTMVGLEILEGQDAYSRPIVVECQWLGGIDSTEDGYLHEVLSDLANELLPNLPTDQDD